MNEVKSLLKHSWENHRAKLLGTILGIVLGSSVMLFGFFATFFVVLCALTGLWIGKKVDDQEDLQEFIERIIPTNFRK